MPTEAGFDQPLFILITPAVPRRGLFAARRNFTTSGWLLPDYISIISKQVIMDLKRLTAFIAAEFQKTYGRTPRAMRRSCAQSRREIIARRDA
jgi:hypothetical protein